MGIGNKVLGGIFILAAIATLLITVTGFGFAVESISDYLAIAGIVIGIFLIWKG